LPPRHGWLEVAGNGRNRKRLKQGIIIDPTRWVFEHEAPYLAKIPPWSILYADYDLGGERLMTVFGKDVVPSDQELEQRGPTSFQETYVQFDKSTWPLLDSLFGRHARIRRGHLQYLANRGPQFLGEHAKPIYEALVTTGHKAWIPIDYRMAVLGQSYDYTSKNETHSAAAKE
jgi:hypothetical protein